MEGYLSEEYVFVYLRTRSELLRDQDCLRELSLDLSKKNRMTKFLLYKGRASKQICIGNERASQQICIGNERASQQICIGRFTNFKLTVLEAVVERWKALGTALLFSAVRCDFDSHDSQC